MWLRDRSYDILVKNEVGLYPCPKDLPGAKEFWIDSSGRGDFQTA